MKPQITCKSSPCAEEIKSDVSIRQAGKGFIIVVWDEFTRNESAVTREELEKIVLYGAAILINPPKLNK